MFSTENIFDIFLLFAGNTYLRHNKSPMKWKVFPSVPKRARKDMRTGKVGIGAEIEVSFVPRPVGNIFLIPFKIFSHKCRTSFQQFFHI